MKSSFSPSGPAAWGADDQPNYCGGGVGAHVFDFTAGTLPASVTFARASSGTYIDADQVLKTGSTDIARFDHDLQDGSFLGLLIEPQRKNFAWKSEALNEANWIAYGTTSVVANATTAPDGALSAEQLNLDAWPNYMAYLNSGVIDNADVIHSTSFFMKKVSGASLRITYRADGSKGNYQISQSSVGSGWDRITPDHPAVTIASDWKWTFATRVDPLIDGHTGAAVAYVWGVQVEEGAFSTSYIPTLPSTATRATDVLTLGLQNGTYELTVETPTATYVESIAVSGGYDFAWSDFIGAEAAGERHLRKITARKL